MVRLQRTFLLLASALPLMHISSSVAWNWPWTRPANFIKTEYKKNPVPVTATVTALAGTALFIMKKIHHAIRTPINPQPTLDNLNVHTIKQDEKTRSDFIVEKGLDNTLIKYSPTILIFVSGYASGAANLGIRGAKVFLRSKSFTSHQHIGDKVYTIPCVAFNFFDKRTSANYGQKLDQDCLELIYRQIVGANPNAKIILFGLCRGAKTIFDWLANKSNEHYSNIKAIIADEPANPELDKSPPNKLYKALKWLFPNYRSKAHTIMQATDFPHKIPIFIGTLKGDRLTTRIKDTIEKLRSFGCSVTAETYPKNFKIQKNDAEEDGKIIHGYLRYSDKFRLDTHKFLSHHLKLPYDEKLII